MDIIRPTPVGSIGSTVVKVFHGSITGIRAGCLFIASLATGLFNPALVDLFNIAESLASGITPVFFPQSIVTFLWKECDTPLLTDALRAYLQNSITSHAPVTLALNGFLSSEAFGVDFLKAFIQFFATIHPLKQIFIIEESGGFSALDAILDTNDFTFKLSRSLGTSSVPRGLYYSDGDFVFPLSLHFTGIHDDHTLFVGFANREIVPFDALSKHLKLGRCYGGKPLPPCLTAMFQSPAIFKSRQFYFLLPQEGQGSILERCVFHRQSFSVAKVPSDYSVIEQGFVHLTRCLASSFLETRLPIGKKSFVPGALPLPFVSGSDGSSGGGSSNSGFLGSLPRPTRLPVLPVAGNFSPVGVSYAPLNFTSENACCIVFSDSGKQVIGSGAATLVSGHVMVLVPTSLCERSYFYSHGGTDFLIPTGYASHDGLSFFEHPITGFPLLTVRPVDVTKSFSILSPFSVISGYFNMGRPFAEIVPVFGMKGAIVLQDDCLVGLLMATTANGHLEVLYLSISDDGLFATTSGALTSALQW